MNKYVATKSFKSISLITSRIKKKMNYDHQKDVNVNHQKFLDGLERLAISAADAQAQIASDAAKHEFRIRFNHYLQEKMKIAEPRDLFGSVTGSTRLYQSICHGYIYKSLKCREYYRP